MATPLRRMLRQSWLGICLLLAWSDIHAAPPPTSVTGFLEKHCVECHKGEKPKGDLRLDNLSMDLADRAVRQHWQDAVDKVQAGEMPPKKKPRPAEDETKAFVSTVRGSLDAYTAAQRSTEGRVVLRRLNRAEYENTIRDLLGIEIDLKDMLPPDSAAGGFDNVGDALHTSSFLMEKYLEAGDAALAEAITNRPKPPVSIAKRFSLKDGHPLRNTNEKVFLIRGDEVTLFSSSAWQQVTLPNFYPADRGRYRIRISASAAQSDGKPVTFRVWGGSAGMGGAPGHLVGYFDAPAGEPKVFEFVDHFEPKTSVQILPYGLASSQVVDKVGAADWKGPGLNIQWAEIEGPLNPEWPPASHRWIFGGLPQAKSPRANQSDRVEVVSDRPMEDAERILRPFVRRAYRRSVTDADLRPFLKLVEKKLAEKRSFEQALRAGLLAVLVSPDFLFLRERATPSTAPSLPPLDDFALAGRLTYFFWSSMPDEPLLQLAGQGKLHEPAVLRQQVDRLLDDPRASQFTHNFLGQWLGLRDIDFTLPSHILYPEFDDMLKASMVREAELFFKELLRDDLPLTNLIASDFSMLNGRLARHYGIPGVDGWEFQKTKLPPESHRGGVLTMAAVLKVTANGTSTSPVVRGAWVMDRILGSPPPRPPADVPAIEPDTRGATTIRQQLAKHRQLESCASCHVSIDPPGFALESFDVIGGFRTHYRSSGNGKPVVIDGRKMSYLQGQPVDPSDVLPDGRPFANIDELKHLLLTDKDRIARALTERLLTYSTGATPEPADRKQVDEIVRRAKEKGYGLRSLVHELTESELFRAK